MACREAWPKAGVVTTRGFASYPVWSADGTRMPYAYQPPGTVDDVYVKDIASSAIAPVLEGSRRSIASTLFVPANHFKTLDVALARAGFDASADDPLRSEPS